MRTAEVRDIKLAKILGKPLLVLALAAVFALPMPGCKKYEEGPSISLRTKKGRLVARWEIESAKSVADGSDIIEEWADFSCEFMEDGKFRVVYPLIGEMNGSWEFVREDTVVKTVVITDLTIIKFYTIKRLKNKELWLVIDDAELHLIIH